MKMLRLKTFLLIVSLCLVVEISQALIRVNRPYKRTAEEKATKTKTTTVRHTTKPLEDTTTERNETVVEGNTTPLQDTTTKSDEATEENATKIEIAKVPSLTKPMNDTTIESDEANKGNEKKKYGKGNNAKGGKPKETMWLNAGNATVKEGWSSWGEWGTCSATCGVGMRSRTRTYTNPRQLRFSNHCFGDSREVELCNIGSFANKVNGGWSAWGSWGTCSVTCDVGIRRRIRSCTNPRPQCFGDHCFGASDEDDLCNTRSCDFLGGWRRK